MNPNILYIMTDQQRFDTLGCYGNPVIRTPNIDSLGKSGMVFQHCYVQNPVCQPSRASMMTGRYVHEHGVLTNLIGLPFHEVTFMQILSHAGYYTAGIGNMHMQPKYGPFGFQYLDLTEGKGGWNDNYRAYLKQKGLYGKDKESKGRKLPFSVYTNTLSKEDYIDSYIGRKAVKFIDENKKRPFFLWVGFSGPHFPFDPPEPYDRIYEPKKVPFSSRVKGELEGKHAMHYLYKKYGFKNLNESITRKVIANYYGNISLIDEWIGKIIEALKRNGLYDDTFILFSSDHGELLGNHGFLWKGDHIMYDAGIRVPFIVSFPCRFKGNRIVKNFVEAVDIMPTFLELAGIEIPYFVQGRSLIPILKGKDVKWRDAVFCEGINIETGINSQARNVGIVMVRTKEWKYIYNHEKEGFSELYDMCKDPAENRNLIKDKKYRDIISSLKRKIYRWVFETQTPHHGETLSGFDVWNKSPVVPSKKQKPEGVTYAKP